MRISEVANLTGLNISNIRFYEKKGLLEPDREHDSKYRNYTDSDVRRIKQIILYRKIGLSIDTIYLLLNEKIEMKEALLWQKQDLQLQLHSLQGALELCNQLINEEKLDDHKLEQYLTYVYESEKEGKPFAVIDELFGEITDYTKDIVFYNFPIVTFLFQKNTWIARIFSVFFWGFLFSLPLSYFISDILSGRDPLKLLSIIICSLIIIIHGTGFFTYHKRVKKERTNDGSII